MALLAVAAISFNACSKDDNQNNDDNNGHGGNTRLVSEITVYYGGGGHDIYNFEYDNQGRITKIMYNDGGGDLVFSYSSRSVNIKLVDSDGYDGIYFTGILNEQGNIVSLFEDDHDGNSYEYIMSYDKNGYLSSWRYSDDDYEKEEYLTWENGDLVQINLSELEQNPEWGEDDEYYDEAYFEYTDYPAKLNIDIVYGLCLSNDFGDTPWFFGAFGLLGRTSSHLIKSWDNCEFSYELDDDGSPIKVVCNNSRYPSDGEIYIIRYK